MRLLRLKITLVFAAFAARAAALWPKPQTFVAGTTPLRLSSDFSIVIGGTGSASQIQSPADVSLALSSTFQDVNLIAEKSLRPRIAAAIHRSSTGADQER